MGLFSRNESANLYQQYDIIADESYTYPTGFGRILAETSMNDMSMFKALIAKDFEEAAYIQEGYDGFSAEVLHEGVKDIFAKIKAFLLRIVEKIKGIFKSFLSKFNNAVVKDNAKYYKKYKKNIDDNNVNWDNFSAKYSMQKQYIEKTFKGIDITTFNNYAEKASKSTNTDDFRSTYLDNNKACIDFLNDTGIEKIDEVSQFDKAFHEFYFEEEKEVKGIDKNIMERITEVMKSGETFGSSIEDTLKKLDKDVKDLVSRLDNLKKEASKNIVSSEDLGDKTTKQAEFKDGKMNIVDKSYFGKEEYDGTDIDRKEANAETANTYYNSSACIYDLSVQFSNAVTKIHNAYLTEITFETKQARSFFVAMVQYSLNSKNKKTVAENSSILITMTQEVAEYEFDSDFELA